MGRAVPTAPPKCITRAGTHEWSHHPIPECSIVRIHSSLAVRIRAVASLSVWLGLASCVVARSDRTVADPVINLRAAPRRLDQTKDRHSRVLCQSHISQLLREEPARCTELCNAAGVGQLPAPVSLRVIVAFWVRIRLGHDPLFVAVPACAAGCPTVAMLESPYILVLTSIERGESTVSSQSILHRQLHV